MNVCTDTNIVFVVQFPLKCLGSNKALWMRRDHLVSSGTLHHSPWRVVHPQTLDHRPQCCVYQEMLDYPCRNSLSPGRLQYSLLGFLCYQMRSHQYREHYNKHLLNTQPHYLTHSIHLLNKHVLRHPWQNVLK